MNALEIKETADRLVNEFGKDEAIRVSEKSINDCPSDEVGFWKEVLNMLKE